MKKNIFFLLCVFSIFEIQAQEKKTALFGVESSYDKIKNDSAKGNIKNIDAFLNFPIFKGEQKLVGGRLHIKSQNISGLDSGLDKSLYGTDINLFWQKQIKDRYKIYLFGQVGIYSDFKDISGEDFRYSLGARYTIRHNDKFSTGWGISYSRQFFGHQLNPFVSVDYQITPKLQLTGLLPIRPKLIYTINENFSWSNEIFGNTTSYRLSATEENSRFVRINNWYGMSKLEYTFAKYHQFSVGLGYNFRNNIKLYEDGMGNNWSIFTFDLNKKSKPIQEINSKGMRFEIGYNFQL